jgi:hypothetical protein
MVRRHADTGVREAGIADRPDDVRGPRRLLRNGGLYGGQRAGRRQHSRDRHADQTVHPTSLFDLHRSLFSSPGRHRPVFGCG